MYQVTELENGFRVATAAMPHMTSVSVGVWVGVGSRYEPAPLNGVCHFIEHLLFKGTQERTAREISQAVEGVGGSLNAFTSEEVTCFHARAGQERFGELLDVLMDMLLNSCFAPADIAKEREVIKEELAMYMDEPQHQVQELLNATLWPRQPLGRPITGTARTLDPMHRRELRGYLRSNYLPDNTVIVAAGNITHRTAVRAVARLAGGKRRGKRPVYAPAQERQQGPRLRLHTRKTEQTQIALGIRTCSRHDARRYAVRLLNTILGENMSSRLFQVVREDHGLAYSVYSTPSFFDDTGDLVISAGLESENLDRAMRLILRELRRMARRPPPAAELRRAREYIFGQMELGLENSETQMHWVGEQMLGYGRILSPARIRQHLSAVTAAEIRDVAAGFFAPNRMSLALVSPLREVDAAADLLKRFR